MHTNKGCVPLPDFLWELCIGDQETGDVVGVKEADEGVDFRVHDWLTHQRQGTVLDRQALLVPLGLHSRDTWKQRGLKANSTADLIPTIKGGASHVNTVHKSKH